MPNGDVTVIPSFIELGGTINLSQATGGNISVDKQGFVRQGTLVTVSTSPSSGYYLSNLTVSLPSGSQNITSSKQFTMPNGNVSVSVSWAKNNYNVSITQVVGGTISASRTGSMPWGTTVTVSAFPAQYYQLNSLTWNGNAISNGGSFVTPQANVNITGSFTQASNVLANNVAFTVKKSTNIDPYNSTYTSWEINSNSGNQLYIWEVQGTFLGQTNWFTVTTPTTTQQYSTLRVIRNSDGMYVDVPYSTRATRITYVNTSGVFHNLLREGIQYLTVIGL